MLFGVPAGIFVGENEEEIKMLTIEMRTDFNEHTLHRISNTKILERRQLYLDECACPIDDIIKLLSDLKKEHSDKDVWCYIDHGRVVVDDIYDVDNTTIEAGNVKF